MPLIAFGTRPTTISLSIQDRDGQRSNAQFQFPGSTTIVDLQARLSALEAVVNQISDGVVVDGTISINLEQTTAFTAPPEASDVERKAVFTFDTANENSFAKIEVPSCDNSVVIDGTTTIDPLVSAALLAAITTGGGINGSGFEILRLR